MTILLLLSLFLICINCQAYTVYTPIESCDTSPSQLDKIDYDLALVRFYSFSANTSLYGINSNCYLCSPIYLASNNTCFGIWTVHKWTLLLQSNNESGGQTLTSISTSFNEFGEYVVVGTEENGISSLTIRESNNGVDSLLPLYITILVIVFIIITSYLAPYILEIFNRKRLQAKNRTTSMHNPMDVGINYDALLQSDGEPDHKFMDEAKGYQWC